MKRYLLTATPLAAMLLLTGCMDDNYDLTNIDKTTKVMVNGLVIPVNVNDLTLDALIEIGDDDDIQIIGQGADRYYAYMYPNPKKANDPNDPTNNTFDSDGIEIATFGVTPSTIDDTEITVHLQDNASPERKAAPSALHLYLVPEDIPSSFTFSVNDIDESVTKISSIGTPDDNKLVFHVTMDFPQFIAEECEKVVVEDLNIRFPKGLNGECTIGDYVDDVVTIKRAPVVNGKLEFNVESKDIIIDKDFKDEGEGKHNYTYNGEIIVEKGGTLELTLKEGVTPRQDFTLTNHYDMSNFEIDRFTGGINYKIKDLNIDPISLEDLPDFLTESGTDLILANPQLYLELNNPVYAYSLEPTTGLAFEQVRNDVPVPNPDLELPGGITIYSNLGKDGVYKYAISPAGNSLEIPNIDALKDYASDANVHKYEFAGLSKVLSGDGLPQKLNVTLSDPKVKSDNVKNFQLGKSLGGVHGSYTFFAPLALDKNSKIYKSDTKTDWSSEDLDRLYVHELLLTTAVSTDVPFEVSFSAEIKNTDGVVVAKSENFQLPAFAKDKEVVLHLKALENDKINTIVDGLYYCKNIDGIDYNAKLVVTEEDSKALSPEQNISLQNVRAKVTGFYLYEDDKK